MRREYKEKLEKNYNAYKARRNDRIIIKLCLILIITYPIARFILIIPDPPILPIYKNLIFATLLSFSFVVIFLYWWRDSIEKGIFLEFYKAYERLGFYFADREKFHLNRAESHIRDALIKMRELLSRRTGSVFYQEAAEPLKELYKGIFKKIIPLNSKRENLKQIHEKMGELALIFLDPNREKILDFNRALKSMPISKQESLFKKYFSKIPRPIILYFVSIGFVIVLVAIFSYFLGSSFTQTLRDGILWIMSISATLTALLIRSAKPKHEKKVPSTSSIKKA